MEIERKFLIHRPNLLSELTLDEITQTYLVRQNEATERRIRWRGTPETGWRHFYTEKTAVSAISRIENEREITPEEYQRLMSEADQEYGTIHKKRYCVPYQEQMLEIDEYDFGLTVLEIELASENDPITLPSWVRVIREVTGEKEYSNAGIAKQRMQQNQSSILTIRT